MPKEDKTFDIIYNWYNTGEVLNEYGLKKGQTIVFILILSLFEQNSVITKYDVIKANRTNESTTNANIDGLKKLGLISGKRSNQFFSRSYLSITPKGLLLKSQLKKVLNSPLGIVPSK